MSKAHMQVHTNKGSREKKLGSKPGPNRAEMGLGLSINCHANLVINTSCILFYLSKALYIECNHRLQELWLGELIQGSILWLVTKKLVIPCFA
jgi:hypothetical protein